MPAPARRDARERGETLLEVLIAVAILAVAVAGVFTGVVTSIRGADMHRRATSAGVLVRSYAEAVEDAVAAPGGYVATCNPNYASGFALPAGFTKSISPPMLWDAATATWVACGGATPDVGLQQLTVNVSSSDQKATESITLVVRKPCGAGSAC